ATRHPTWSCLLSLRCNPRHSGSSFAILFSLPFQLTQCSTALCHASCPCFTIPTNLGRTLPCTAACVTNRTNLGSTLSCTAACVTNHTNLGSTLSCILALHYDELLFTMTIGDVLQEFQHNRSNSQCPLSI